MSALSPRQAALIANGVYNVRDQASLADADQLDQGLGIEGLFSVAGAARLVGDSGPMIARSRTGFGYVARGERNREGEVLVALRGTATLHDALTDLNFGLAIGPGHLPVHAGFNDTFNTLVDQISENTRNSLPTAIHCVGHSLGGALATLAAAHLHNSGFAGVNLYSFGSPRVGGMLFSRSLTRQLGSSHIYRVNHDADPVPMVPLFPFCHVPLPGTEYPMEWHGGGRMFWNAHSMTEYIASVGDHAWPTLAEEPWDPAMRNIESWLGSAELGPAMFRARTLQLIGQALQWIIQKVVVGVVGTALAIGATLLDKLAWLIATGAAASLQLAEYTGALMSRIMRWLGRALQSGINLTVTFVRWVLGLLYSSVANMVSLAMGGVRRVLR